MAIEFQVKPLISEQFTSLFKMRVDQLNKNGASLITVDRKPGFPCRVSLKDAEIGEQVLLLNYHHHVTSSPYAASGPIFIRKGARETFWEKNQIPKMLVHRMLSIRAYDKDGVMTAAHVVEGAALNALILDMFSISGNAYLQVHNAGPGCFNCQIDRIA